MKSYLIRAEEVEHTGDIERYTSVITRFRDATVRDVRMNLPGEYESATFVVDTQLTCEQLQARLDADDDTQGFCWVEGSPM